MSSLAVRYRNGASLRELARDSGVSYETVRQRLMERREPRRVNVLPLKRAARNQILYGYKWGAMARGLTWALSGTQFDAIIQKPCHYCKLPPSNKSKYKKHGILTYSGIDRKDNNIGYTPRNVVPCCWFCNKAKKTHSYADFMAWIQRLKAS